jgi:hypothetical protein
MPFVLNDRVLEISTTTGTVPFVLGGPPSGYQSFLSGIGGSNTTFYAAFNTVANEWELGLGTLNAGATELTRTTIYSSSNSNLVVNFSAGTKNVFVTLPSSQTLTANQSNIFTAAQTFRAANAVRSEAAATQDAVVLAGRAGGTSSYAVTITPTTLTANSTLTLANGNTTLVSGTTAVLGTAQTFTAAKTFRAANAVRSEAAATQDAVVIAGRAGGTGSFAVTLTPTTLASSTTLTLPNVTDTVATIGTAQTFTAAQTFRAANAIRSEAASTQDAVVIAGRAGGTGSFAATLTPTTLSANRTLTLPDADTTLVGTDTAQALSNKTITYTAGTTSVAPIVLASGANLTSAAAGAVEYDGVRFYGTTDTVSGRGYIPSIQIFRLTANGAAIGPGISNFFGANSAINLVGGGVYELEAYCYFTKTTAGTVTVTLTASAAVVNLNGTVDYGAAAGGVATGAANRISLFASAATANAFGASVSLTTAVNHAFIIRAIFDANAANSNIRIDFTSSAGTVTPLRNSYYKITRLPAGNSGSYAA